MNRNRQLLVRFAFGLCRAAPFALFLAIVASPSLPNAQTPANDVAAQIRAQGYPCEDPVTANRDIGRSGPNAPVWILRCLNESYSVTLHPDMAAGVNRLEP